MKKSIFITTLACLALLTGCTQRVIFDNGIFSSENYLTSDPSASQVLASSFTLDQDSNSISGFRWWGRYVTDESPQETDAFRIHIYTDENGYPGLELLSSVVGGNRVTLNKGDSTVYEYTASIQTMNLLPQTTYWFSVHNDTTIDENDEWVWEHAIEPFSGVTVQELTANPEVWEDASDTPRAFQVTALPF